MFAKIKATLDSAPFQIFFAAWTGVYLVQLFKGEFSAGSQGNLVNWLFIGLVLGILFF